MLSGGGTMLATATLASNRAAIPIWVGASVGMTLASGIAMVITTPLGSRLPERVVRMAAAGAFLVFGVLLLFDGIRG